MRSDTNSNTSKSHIHEIVSLFSHYFIYFYTLYKPISTIFIETGDCIFPLLGFNETTKNVYIQIDKKN